MLQREGPSFQPFSSGHAECAHVHVHVCVCVCVCVCVLNPSQVLPVGPAMGCHLMTDGNWPSVICGSQVANTCSDFHDKGRRYLKFYK